MIQLIWSLHLFSQAEILPDDYLDWLTHGKTPSWMSGEEHALVPTSETLEVVRPSKTAKNGNLVRTAMRQGREYTDVLIQIEETAKQNRRRYPMQPGMNEIPFNIYKQTNLQMNQVNQTQINNNCQINILVNF